MTRATRVALATADARPDPTFPLLRRGRGESTVRLGRPGGPSRAPSLLGGRRTAGRPDGRGPPGGGRGLSARPRPDPVAQMPYLLT